MKSIICGLRAGLSGLTGLILFFLVPPATAGEDPYTQCPLCTEWDVYSKNCEPITTLPYKISPHSCNSQIKYVTYEPSRSALGYISPNAPLSPPNNLFVTNRCHEGIMKYRIEGMFYLYSFSIYVVNGFLITSPNCNWPVNTERPRDYWRIEITRTHELTHCNTLCMAINICNARVVNAGWFSSRAAANARRLEIIAEGNNTWTTSLGLAVANKDVAGQPRSYINGECLTEIDNGTWPY